MKITKYPHSCFYIETSGKSILVDPGNNLYDAVFLPEWKNADFILITHKHGDHCYSDIIKNIDTPIYASSEVAAEYPNLKINIVKSGDILQLTNEISVEITKAVHGYLPFLKHNNAQVYENTGFIVNTENKKIWFTSDTLCFDNDYKCDILCAPVSGHGLVMGAYELVLFAKECAAKLVLPCHMDSPRFPVDIENMESILKLHEINYQILQIKEVINL
ncbi:MAG: MBL fold metallo-hydrolase [Rickettsiales bacterium]|jgi:L-ascorbate metabolism protein UlaG (beta-lactamase superfamily)|nr:MBL fold metallo-hydrolase [Rickettsiales bacterium]